ncbi:MAG: coiled-coil domain-containing protein [Planctomycetota bacterium]
MEEQLHAAGHDVRRKEFADAIVKQTAALVALLEAEFRIRHGAELEALLEVKGAYARILSEHEALRQEIARWDEAKLAADRAKARSRERRLARDTRLTIVPPELAESASATQFAVAAEPVQRVDVGEAAGAAVKAMEEAASALADADAAARREGISKAQAEASLRRAIQGIEQRIQKIMHLTHTMRRLQEARRRLRRITQLQEDEQGLLDDTREAVENEEECVFLASPQAQLGMEVKQFRAGLEKGNEPSYSTGLPLSKYVSMMCRPLPRAAAACAGAAKALAGNGGKEAVEPEVRAVRELDEAREIAQQEVETLERISELLALAGDLRRLAMYLSELEAEQRALRVETEDAGSAKEKLPPLAKPQATLGRAVGDVIAMLEGIAPARDLDQVLRQTHGVMEQAGEGLERGLVSEGKAAAVPQQRKAEELLVEARKLALSLAEQYDYTAEWLAFLQSFQADAMDLLGRQVALRLETQGAEVAAFAELAGEQDILQAEADTFAQLFRVGSEDYSTAAREMSSAAGRLKASDRDKALHHMVLAEEALRKALAQLLAAMEALEEVPMISLMAEVPDQANVLLQALMLAAEQRKLRLRTRASPSPLIDRFAAPQTKLQRKTSDLMWEADGSALIGEAEREMTSAARFLGLKVRPDAVRHQQLAEKALRRYILEMALQLFQLEEEFMEPSGMPSMPSPLPVVMTMESFHLFTKTAVEGELVKGGRSEWRVLGKRERAALNENLARELPLEYRAILKGYYEKLAE